MLSRDQFGGGTPHLDEMERVMGADRLRYPLAHERGGEWDPIRTLPPRTQRSLRGAGYLTKSGLAPDVAATHHIGPHAGHDDTDAAVEWYVRTATGAIAERRQQARRSRDQRAASAQGYRTPHQLRTFQAILEGHDTYAAKRKARGW